MDNKNTTQTQPPAQNHQQSTSQPSESKELSNKDTELKIPPPLKAFEAPDMDKKGAITVLLLTFLPPIGTIFMWSWMRKWPLWLKISITAPLILIVIAVILVTVFIGAFPLPHQ